MEENAGSRYALHVALQTLKERCQNLQQRLSILEEENTDLRVRCSRNESSKSFTELDALKTKVVELSEQKAKLETNFTLVANENKQLWSRLSRLLEVNKSLGSHLTKINESLNQHSKKALIRSNTFTQSDTDARKAVIENDKISLELEDVSLKLISTIVKEKSELEAQCSEMLEMQNPMSPNSFGFSYLKSSDDSLVEEFEQHLIELKSIKDSLKEQNRELEAAAVVLDSIKYDDICQKCSKSVKVTAISNDSYGEKDMEDELQLESLARWGTPENSNLFLQDEQMSNICPMCSKKYTKRDVTNFLAHVENHFKI